MRKWINLLLALLLVLLFCFYQIEFSSFPHIQEMSTRKLLKSSTDLPKRVIFLVIDSLRYDYYQRLPVFEKIQKKQPNSTFMVKTMVGNPTMTTQRIESLMTGSQIFSSGNILKTFLASKTEIDNIIHQLTVHNKTSMVFGDDTWEKLFDFTDYKICAQTFDVQDYDTCDKLIYRYLSQQVYGTARNISYDLLIGHFLALDHIGHATSSITDNAMNVKMRDISAFIELLIDKMDNQTMMLVTGDHGMREDGNHGGSTQSQTETFLFGYYKGKQLFEQKWRDWVTQSDITATLSILLDIPIPSNVIGYPILKALPDKLMKNSLNLKEINNQMFNHYQLLLKFYDNKLNDEQRKQMLDHLKSQYAIKAAYMLQSVSDRLSFLKFSSPNQLLAIIVLIIMSLNVLSLIIIAFWKDLKPIFNLQCTKFMPTFNLIFPCLSLFIMYFSWYLIQRLSTIITIVFIMTVLIGVASLHPKRILINLFTIIMFFVLLNQIEPKKVNEYITGFLRIEAINEILRSQLLNGLITTFAFLMYFRITLKRTRKPNKNSQKNQQNFDKLTVYMKLLITFFGFLNYVTTYCSNQPIYPLRIIIFIIIIGWLIKEAKDKSNIHIIFLLTNIIALFLGIHSPLILLCIYMIDRYCFNTRNYTIIMSILAECVWWWLGNRYEFSGIDVMKSYIFYRDYIAILNGFCLLIYLISPYIMIYALINKKIERQNQQKITITETLKDNQQKAVLKQDSSSLKQSINLQKTRSNDNNYQTSLQFISTMLLGLLSCAWNVHYNNQKILFTVVYVPMLFFCTIKTASMALIILLTNNCLTSFPRRPTKTNQTVVL